MSDTWRIDESGTSMPSNFVQVNGDPDGDRELVAAEQQVLREQTGAGYVDREVLYQGRREVWRIYWDTAQPGKVLSQWLRRVAA